MRFRLIPPSCSSGRGGAALVLVLACVAILSVLVLAYLGHSLLEGQISAASVGQTRADVLAQGAIQSVIGELKQEIAAGSTNYPPTGSDLRDPNCIFLPRANLAAVPYQMDSGAPANVLKRSAYGLPFYQGSSAVYDESDWPAPSYAADASSTNFSYNGRYVSLARWNLPILMPKADPTSTNLEPVAGFVAPDWVYLDRTGSPVTSWDPRVIPDRVNNSINTNRVVGRYAYVVYDEGGLLDANAAGYPSSVSATMVRNKISEACADLTQIGLQNSDIDALVAWRNPVNGISASAYTNYVYTTNAADGATNAFLTPVTGERLFTSRQQLIAFLTQNVAVTPADVARMQNALPFLTHFSRALNAPTWYPEQDASAWGGSASYAYADNRLAPTTVNPFVPYVRTAGTFSNDSGLTVEANQPMVFSRFPLTRLLWLGSAGPNGATAAQIQQSFGLTWDASIDGWKYSGPSGSGTEASIETLQDVQGENREPNFFELLKAGILSGSLGMYVTADTGPLNLIDSRYAQADEHVIQIGLNIIDQASSSPLPTRIEFGSSTGSSALYGSKPLPYLYKMTFTPYRPAGNNTYFNAWMEPILWNPYQSLSTNSSPLNIRVFFNAGSIFAATAFDEGDTNPTTGNEAYGSAYTTPALATNSYLGINANDGGALAAAASTPSFLGTLATNTGCALTTDGTSQEQFHESGVTYDGFWLGQAYAPNPPANDGPQNVRGLAVSWLWGYPYFSSSLNQFVVQADYGGTAGFQEVQRMDFAGVDSGVWSSDANYATVLQRRQTYLVNEDPRTGRFGFNYAGHLTNSPSSVGPTELAWATQTTFAAPTNNFPVMSRAFPRSRSGNGAISFNYGSATWTAFGNSFHFADNSSAASGASALMTPAYTDSDGVQRAGDAWWNSTNANTMPMREDVTTYRPVFLGRSYTSVGELGYVFRDLPWRSLNFCTTNSPDAALLDLFCVNDGYAGDTNAPLVGGRVDLNTRNPDVLAALLNGAARSELLTNFDIDSGDATAIANSIVGITSSEPLLNKAEIATRLAPADPTVTSSNPDSNIKERREAIVRALAEVGQVRTWNLMIDVIAQAGRFPPSATNLNQFVVEGERRYWAHVALDRYSGQVIDIQLEPVSQ